MAQRGERRGHSAWRKEQSAYLLTTVFLIFEFSFVYLRALRGLIFTLGIALLEIGKSVPNIFYLST